MDRLNHAIDHTQAYRSAFDDERCGARRPRELRKMIRTNRSGTRGAMKRETHPQANQVRRDGGPGAGTGVVSAGIIGDGACASHSGSRREGLRWSFAVLWTGAATVRRRGGRRWRERRR